MPTELGARMFAAAIGVGGVSTSTPAVLIVVDGGAVQVVKSMALSPELAIEVLQRAIEGLNAKAEKALGSAE